MTIPTLTTLPVAPARTDPPATFVTRADAFLAAIVTFQGEMNTSIGAMNTDIAQVNTDATAAAASATSAASSATAAANAAGAALWVSGQAYAEGDAAISLINYQTYRAETATSGTTDPSADANWTAISGTFPVQTGNAGKYLTTDGTDTSWGEVSGSPTLEATASGSLSNGDLVSINTDGTVSVVSQTAQSFGTEVEFTSNQLEYIDIAYHANAGKVVIAYRNLSVGNYGYAILGTVSGSTISFETPFVFLSASATWISIVYSPTAQKVVFCWVPSSTIPIAKVGTISGSSMTFGSDVYIGGVVAGDNIKTIYHPAQDKIIAAYRNTSDGNRGYIAIGTISGTSISFAGQQDFGGAHAQDMALSYDSQQQKILISYTNFSNNYYGTATVINVSGNSFTAGNGVVYRSGSTAMQSNAYDSINGKHIIAYRSASENNRGKCNIATVSGTTVSFPATQEQFSASTYADQINVTFDEDTGLIGFVFRHGAASNRYVTATYVAGDTLSFSSEFTWGSQNGVWLRTANIGSSTFVSAYRDNNNTPTDANDGYAIVFNNTSSNYAKYIGISDAAYSDAATATVQIVGSVDDAQSGLSAGTKYYVTETGTLSTTENSVYAGIAASSTKLIVKG